MNELKRNGKRTREQLTFSDTYLVLDNLREYDFDLVSFYVTFNQYIDRRNYEGKADNSLIFANNEALFKAFNVSRNRFYRLLKLSYECGLIDIEKGSNNRNIYILNDTIPFEPLKKIRKWENRNGQGKGEVVQSKEEDVEQEEVNQNNVFKGEKARELDLEETKIRGEKYHKKSHPKKGQLQRGRRVKTLVPKRDELLSRKGMGSYPEKGQLPNSCYSDDFNALNRIENISNSSKGLIDLSFNISKSISQSIYDNNNTYDNNVNNGLDRQDRLKARQQLKDEYEQTMERCEINHIDDTYREAVTHAIKLLFLDIENKKTVKIGENLIPTEIARNDLKKLNFLILEHAINKFKEAARTREIKNTVAYLKACIYNAIHEVKIEKLCIDPRDKYALLPDESSNNDKEKSPGNLNNKFKTKFHLARSRGDKYTADELEQLVLSNQKKKLKEKLNLFNKAEYKYT